VPAGDHAGARDQYAALLPVIERISGPQHPLTLITRGDLARWTGEAGDPAAARDQAAALLPVMERVLGAEHPKTLAARGRSASASPAPSTRTPSPPEPASLAYWTRQAGRDKPAQ
jgi:Tetratricopeptide repeat